MKKCEGMADMLILINLISTTIRLTEEQKRFLKQNRQDTGEDFSGWVRKKLEEEMRKNSFFLKQKKEELQQMEKETMHGFKEELKRIEEEINRKWSNNTSSKIKL